MQDNKRPQENERTVRDALHSRAFKNGAYASVLCAVMLALVVALNLFVGALPAKYLRYDMTENKLYSLSQETEDLCAALTQDVTFYYLGRTGQEDAAVTELLDKYKDASSHIQVVQKDPVLYPTFGAAYDAADAAVGSIIAVCGERYRVVDAGDLYTYTPNYQTYTYDTEFDGEGALTSALSYVASEEALLLYTLSGHGEAGLSATLTDGAERQNMSFETLALLTADAVPEDAAAVVLNAPTKDISAEEAERLRATAQDALSQAREERDKLIRQGQAELEAAREKARRMAADVERQAYDLLDELRKLEKDKTRAASQRAARAREIARKDSEKLFLKSDVVHTVQREYTPLKKAEPGQEVYLVELDKTGIVSSRPDKDGLVEVRAGILRTKVPLSKLAAPPKFQKQEKTSIYTPRPRRQTDGVREAARRTASMEVNLLGMTVEEALETDRFIDNGVLSGQTMLYLIHGKGTGALRKAIHEHLRRHPSVKSFRLGNYGEGEAGVTVVELK